MSKVEVSENYRHRFYNRKFAWLPIGIYEKGDKYNSATIAARWLFFTISDSVLIRFNVSLELDFCELHFRLSLPYVNFHFQIRTPFKLKMWLHSLQLYRKGEESKYKWLR